VLVDILANPGVSESVLVGASRWFRPFRSFRVRRSIAALVSIGLARRDDDESLALTVAGMGVVYPFISLDSSNPLFPSLREMLLAEHRVSGVPGSSSRFLTATHSGTNTGSRLPTWAFERERAG
jgi:hypothetical protein